VKPLTVLMTGASGLIGAEVAARLAESGHAVVGLVHSRQDLIRNDGGKVNTTRWDGMPRPGSVACVTGDITTDECGLPTKLYRMLAVSVDRVVHCAAITDFGRDPEIYESVNVRGTRNVFEFARNAPAEPIPFVHVSTAYVAGERIGRVMEADLDAGQRFGTAYEDSKYRAELELRRQAATGVPIAVVRPSIVVGAERTGVVREFQNMYVVLKTLTDGRVGSIPGHYAATLDLVPVDYVASLVAQVTTRFEQAEGKTFHAVGQRPFTLRDFSDVLAEYPSFQVPRYVPPETFSADRLPEPEQVYYERIVSLYESYFRRRLVFDDTEARRFLGRPPRSQGLPFLRKLLDYAVQVGYMGAPLPDVAQVLASLAQAGGPAPMPREDPR